eukprot:scaffold9431_cov111-Isochrysis_galbana.AAC.2
MACRASNCSSRSREVRSAARINPSSRRRSLRSSVGRRISVSLPPGADSAAPEDNSDGGAAELCSVQPAASRRSASVWTAMRMECDTSGSSRCNLYSAAASPVLTAWRAARSWRCIAPIVA